LFYIHEFINCAVYVIIKKLLLIDRDNVCVCVCVCVCARARVRVLTNIAIKNFENL